MSTILPFFSSYVLLFAFLSFFFFFNDTATTEIYTLSLHDALPIWPATARLLGYPVRRIFRLAMLGLVLVLVAFLSALTSMRFARHGREVQVPQLAGKATAEAEGLLSNLGLTLEVENRFYSAKVREGGIVSQIPQPGTNVRRGWRVRVALSLGPQRVSVPNVLGESGRAAEINVQRRGLELGA